MQHPSWLTNAGIYDLTVASGHWHFLECSVEYKENQLKIHNFFCTYIPSCTIMFSFSSRATCETCFWAVTQRKSQSQATDAESVSGKQRMRVAFHSGTQQMSHCKNILSSWNQRKGRTKQYCWVEWPQQRCFLISWMRPSMMKSHTKWPCSSWIFHDSFCLVSGDDPSMKRGTAPSSDCDPEICVFFTGFPLRTLRPQC